MLLEGRYLQFFVPPKIDPFKLLCLPSHREVGTCCFTFVHSVRPLSLCLWVPSFRAGDHTRDVDPMLGYCWPTVCDAGPVSNQHWFNTSCLLGLSLSVCAVVSPSSIHFSPALSMAQAVKHETLTQCWTNVGPPSTTLSQHKPVLGYCVVFGATLNVGQRHRQRANITQKHRDVTIPPACRYGRIKYWLGQNGYWPNI